MILPLSSICFPKEKRLRQEYNNIEELSASLKMYGQLQAILVRPFNPEEWPDEDPNYEWVVVGGGRRYFAVESGAAVRGMEPGHIRVETTETESEIFALEMEFHENEDREALTWQEKAEYVRRIHEAHCESNSKWDVGLTAAVLKMSEPSVYEYLSLTKDTEIYTDERVQSADSLRAAKKQAKRARAMRDRKEMVKQEDGFELGKFDSLEDLHDRAKLSVTHRDARDWLPTLPDEEYDWGHWDPPYGGEQRGGARVTLERFDDSEEYAWTLIQDVLPELHRVLRDGAWLALWYHPKFYGRAVALLQGHRFVESPHTCDYCGKGWDDIHSVYECHKSPFRFWVNPYPYVWYKPDRVADGHEITRFSVNAWEPFLLAAKHIEREPILPISSTQNVISHTLVGRTEREHVTQKPVGLLQEIIKMISISGEHGIDPSTGSGSILEAAFRLGRWAEGCEISENYYLISLEAAMRGLGNIAADVG